MPFDLSKVFFITTANALDTIPPALLDRLEVLRLSGYSEEEKVEIAERYIVPRQLHPSGLTPMQLRSCRMARSAGHQPATRAKRVCENWRRMLARVARKVARKVAQGETQPIMVEPANLVEMLGPERFFLGAVARTCRPGVATGLAWTEAGGEVLYVEASLLPGSRHLRLTGQLGDVMRESAKTAQSYVWSHAEKLGVNPKQFRQAGLHIHVPAGAVPQGRPVGRGGDDHGRDVAVYRHAGP